MIYSDNASPEIEAILEDLGCKLAKIVPGFCGISFGREDGKDILVVGILKLSERSNIPSLYRGVEIQIEEIEYSLRNILHPYPSI